MNNNEYNVLLEDAHGNLSTYCVAWHDLATAKRTLDLYRSRYGDGITPKAYPNGKGYYPVKRSFIAARKKCHPMQGVKALLDALDAIDNEEKAFAQEYGLDYERS